jgi:RHS repeat-associated protein
MESRTDPRGYEPGANPGDFTTVYTYDNAGNVLTETDPLGGVTTYAYDDSGRLATRTDARGKQTSYEYNAAGEVTKIMAPDGGQTLYDYDASGNLISETDAEDGETTYAYDDAGRLVSKTDPGGKTWTYDHDAAGRLISETDPAGGKKTYGYDLLGRMKSKVSPRGNEPGANSNDFKWTYDYDPAGNLISKTDPLGNETTYTHDHGGRVLTETDPAGKTTTFTYDATGNLLTEKDPLDHTTTNVYDDDGRLFSTTDPRGKTTTYDRDAAANLKSATSPLGSKTSMSYDPLGRLDSRTDARGNEPGADPEDYTTEFDYDPVGNLLAEVDPLGNATSYTYDDAGNRETKRDALNRTTSYVHDNLGRLESLTAPDEADTSYTYDEAGNLESRTDANGNTTTFAHDPLGRVISEEAPGTNSFEAPLKLDPDAPDPVLEFPIVAGNAGEVNATLDSESTTPITRTDSPSGSLDVGTTATHEIKADGRTVTHADLTWTKGNHPVSETTTHNIPASGSSVTKTIAPDAAGDISAQVDWAKITKSRSLNDSVPNLGQDDNALVVNGNGTISVTLTWGSMTPNRNLDLFLFEGTTERDTSTQTSGNSETVTYNVSGLSYPATRTFTIRVKAVTLGQAYQLNMSYPLTPAVDLKLENGSGDLVASSSIVSGQPRRALTLGDAEPSTYVLRMSSADEAAPNATLTETHQVKDYATLALRVKDGSGAVVGGPVVASSGASRLFAALPTGGDYTVEIENTSSDLGVPEYTLTTNAPTLRQADLSMALKNAAGETVATGTEESPSAIAAAVEAGTYSLVVTPSGGRANADLSVTYPYGVKRTFEFDADGNVVKEVDPRGNVTADPDDGTTIYTYDNAGRRTGINYSDSTPDVTLDYDERGLRESATDGAGTETRSYDDAGQLTGITRDGQTFSYDHDAAGNITRRTYPDGTVVDSGYNDDGRLASVTAGDATTAYGYDAASNLTATTFPNGNAETRTYDPAGRNSTVEHKSAGTTFATFTRTLDAVGNPTLNTTPDGPFHYRYDDQDRLTHVCDHVDCPPSPERIVYGYDGVGNRTQESRDDATTTYAYDTADELVSATTEETTTFGYDAAGNMARAGGLTLTYDLAGRTSSLTEAAETVTYSYDADGRRIRASSGAEPEDTTAFTWDPTTPHSEVVRESGGSGDLVRRYVHGHGPISMADDDETHYYHTDSLGSVTSVASSTGAAEWRYSYEPFGSARTTEKIVPTGPDNPVRFAGELLDATGLYHLRARQYDPGLGRFTARDPLPPHPFESLVSSYAYANNRPCALIDPSGLRASSGSFRAQPGTGDDKHDDRWWVFGPSSGSCEDQLREIVLKRNLLQRQLRNFRENKLGFTPDDPRTATHQLAWEQHQGGLRSALQSYTWSCGGDGVPSDAWTLATMPTPYPSQTGEGAVSFLDIGRDVLEWLKDLLPDAPAGCADGSTACTL